MQAGARPETRRGRTPAHSAALASQIITVTLHDYWCETISKQEALRRLRDRSHLTSAVRVDIAKRIPNRTRHYLTFHGNAFREYADLGNGRGFLMLVLPLIRDRKTPSKVKVIAPAYRNHVNADGSIESTSRIDLHQYHSTRGILFEDGRPRPTFRYSSKPVSLPIDTTFIAPPRSVGVGPAECCSACEWLHSVLRIHDLDSICCMGVCRIPKHFLPVFV
jgi:hypothetical protein